MTRLLWEQDTPSSILGPRTMYLAWPIGLWVGLLTLYQTERVRVPHRLLRGSGEAGCSRRSSTPKTRVRSPRSARSPGLGAGAQSRFASLTCGVRLPIGPRKSGRTCLRSSGDRARRSECRGRWFDSSRGYVTVSAGGRWLPSRLSYGRTVRFDTGACDCKNSGCPVRRQRLLPLLMGELQVRVLPAAFLRP